MNYIKMSPLVGLSGYGGGASSHTFVGLGYGGTGKWNGAYGYYSGGEASGVEGEQIQKWTIQSTSNATDVGDLQTVSKYGSSASSGDYCFHFGGDSTGGSGTKETDISKWAGTGGTSSLFGDMSGGGESSEEGRQGTITGCDGKRLIQIGGNGVEGANDADSWFQDHFFYWDAQDGSAGATVFGDMIDCWGYSNPVNDATRMVTMGGRNYSGNQFNNVNTMEYITFAVESNATNFGDLAETTFRNGSGGNETRGISTGGSTATMTHSNTNEYITIQTPSNSTDFGNLATGRYYPGGASDMTRLCIAGGWNGGYVNKISYVTIDTTGGVTDAGDLVQATGWGAGCAGG